MDEHKAVALFGVVAAPTAGLARIMQISTLKMGRLFDGGIRLLKRVQVRAQDLLSRMCAPDTPCGRLDDNPGSGWWGHCNGIPHC